MTSDQAMRAAEVLFGDDALTAPEFMRKLEESFEQAPRFHQQLPLPLQEVEMEDSLPGSEKGRKPRQSPLKPSLPPPLQFRVEVWRESKKGLREVRVIQL